MNKTCKNCKHGGAGGGCNSDKFVEESWGDPMPEDGMLYWDYEGYSAGFRTGPDFGCVHFAPPTLTGGQ